MVDPDVQAEATHGAVIFACVSIALVTYLLRARKRASDLSSIPTIGPAGFLVSYLGAVRFLYDARRMLQEGYEKFPVFKVANPFRWLVVVTGSALVEELRKAPDDVMSFTEVANEANQIPYTMGTGNGTDSYHATVLGTQLTRNLPLVFPAIREEVVAALNDVFPQDGSEWIEVPALNTVTRLVCRVNNRIFVGPGMCRDADFISLTMGLPREVFVSAIVVSMFPKFLRPIAARLFTSLPRTVRRTQRLLQPIVRERRENMDHHEREHLQKPNDLLSWIMAEVEGSQTTEKDLALRILAVNLSATHTSSMALTHALYHLAANPIYVQPMRDEIESVVRKEGWTKAGIDRMRKVDSFLKESMRFSGLRAVSMMRKALKPYTFSDGTHVPAGTFVFAASTPVHFDPANYPNAHEFDGFRFSDLEERQYHVEEGSGGGSRYQMTTATADYLAWGYGRHACPGRFFAAAELKLMLAHIVVNYDVKLCGTSKGRPSDIWVEANCLPNLKAKMMFRRRVRPV